MIPHIIYGATVTGPVRHSNQDHILVGSTILNAGEINHVAIDDSIQSSACRFLYAVADGIGGRSGGAVASGTVLNVLAQSAPSSGGLENRQAALEEQIRRAHQAVQARAHADPALSGLGCTLSGLCLIDDDLLTFHCGDSRLYRWRDGLLKLLSDDDTLSTVLERASLVTAARSPMDSFGGMLTQFVGNDRFDIRIGSLPPPRPRDILLICSDGLHRLVTEDDIAKILGRTDHALADRGRMLVASAEQAGGVDNISVILVEILPPEATWNLLQ